MTNNNPIKILLVEDNPDDVYILRRMMSDVISGGSGLTHVKFLSETAQYIGERFDVILLDLGLPDSQGFDTFVRMHNQFPEVPILILSALEDETLAIHIVQAGAQDYLVKGNIDSKLLIRVIRYAIERHQMMIVLRNAALIDELTGLYNRRGFLTIATQYLGMAQRTKDKLSVIFIDVDGLKSINDTFGHKAGDNVLVAIAGILKKTFRYSDIISRFGGDEFAVLALYIPDKTAEIITAQLENNLSAYNMQKSHPYELSLSAGIACFNPEHPASIEELLSQADKTMYQRKQSKKGP